MAGSKIGHAGQAYTGLGSMRRAQGAQSRFGGGGQLPQVGTMVGRAARGTQAKEVEQQWHHQLWLDQQKRIERLAFYRGLAGMVGEGAISIAKAKDRRKIMEEIATAELRSAGVPLESYAAEQFRGGESSIEGILETRGRPVSSGLQADIERELGRTPEAGAHRRATALSYAGMPGSERWRATPKQWGAWAGRNTLLGGGR